MNSQQSRNIQNDNRYFLRFDEQQITDLIVKKFNQHGFDKLSSNDLIFALLFPFFANEFEKQTKINWHSELNGKALVRIKADQSDLNSFLLPRKCSDFALYEELFIAVAKNDFEKTSFLLKRFQNSKLNTIYTSSGKSPLHVAIKNGSQKMVELLLKSGFCPESRDKFSRTAFHLACMYGHPLIFQQLIDTKNEGIHQTDLRMRGVVHFACSSLNVGCLKIIERIKPSLLGLIDDFGRSGIHYAVINSSPEMILMLKILISNGVNVNGVDAFGRSCLHYIAESAKLRAVSFLATQKINFELRESQMGKTAFELAVNESVKKTFQFYNPQEQNQNNNNLQNQNSIPNQEIRKVYIQEEPANNFCQKNNILNANSEAIEKDLKTKQDSKNCMVSDWTKNQFLNFLKNFQEKLSKNQFHLFKPEMFNGSWLNGVSTESEFVAKIKQFSSIETLFVTFNIINPTFTSGTSLNSLNKENCKKIAKLFDFEISEQELNQGFSNQIQKIANCEKNRYSKNAVFQTKNQNFICKTKVQIPYFEENSTKITNVGFKDNPLRQDLLLSLKEENDNLKKKNDFLESEKNLMLLRIHELELSLKSHKEIVQKTNLILNSLKEKCVEQSALENGANIQNLSEKQVNFPNPFLVPSDVQNNLNLLLSNIRSSKLPIADLLKLEDKNCDGSLSHQEFAYFLLKNTNEQSQVVSLVNFFTLNKRCKLVPIAKLVDFINKRTEVNETHLNELLFRFLDALKLKKIDFDSFFSASNITAFPSKFIDFSEFKKLFEKLTISSFFLKEDLTNLFSLFNENNGGKISVESIHKQIMTARLLCENKDEHFSQAFKKRVSKTLLTKKSKNVNNLAVPNNIESKNQKQDLLKIKEFQEKGSNEAVSGIIRITLNNFKTIASEEDSFKITSFNFFIAGVTPFWIKKQTEINNLAQNVISIQVYLHELEKAKISDILSIILHTSNDESHSIQESVSNFYEKSDIYAVKKVVKIPHVLSFELKVKFQNLSYEIMGKSKLQNFEMPIYFEGKILVQLNLETLEIQKLEKTNSIVEVLLPNNEIVEYAFTSGTSSKSKSPLQFDFYLSAHKKRPLSFIFFKIFKNSLKSEENLTGKGSLDFNQIFTTEDKSEFSIDFNPEKNVPLPKINLRIQKFENFIQDLSVKEKNENFVLVLFVDKIYNLSSVNKPNETRKVAVLNKPYLKVKISVKFIDEGNAIMSKDYQFESKVANFADNFVFKEKFECSIELKPDSEIMISEAKASFELWEAEDTLLGTNCILGSSSWSIPSTCIRLSEFSKSTISKLEFTNVVNNLLDPHILVNIGLFKSIDTTQSDFLYDERIFNQGDEILSMEGMLEIYVCMLILEQNGRDFLKNEFDPNNLENVYIELQIQNLENQKSKSTRLEKNTSNVFIFKEKFCWHLSPKRFQSSDNLSIKLCLKTENGVFSNDSAIGVLSVPIFNCFYQTNQWIRDSLTFQNCPESSLVHGDWTVLCGTKFTPIDKMHTAEKDCFTESQIEKIISEHKLEQESCEFDSCLSKNETSLVDSQISYFN